MKKKGIIIAVAAIAAAVIGAVLFTLLGGAGPFAGTVTDENGKPIENVSVTDGRNVVKTGKDGRYELPGFKKTHFISVTVPSAYSAESFYIPAEKGRDSYDFTLTAKKEEVKRESSFLQISDTEIGENGTGAWLDYLKDLAKEKKPDFLIHTGDICYEAGLKRHIKDMNTKNMPVPVYYIIGNHDYVDGKSGEELYESIYGPVWYSFEYGNVHYAVTPIQHGDKASCYADSDRWKWLENDLKNTDPSMKVVIFNHTNSPEEDFVFNLGDRKLDLKQYNLAAWVFGHYHYSFTREKNGVVEISAPRPDCGGIDSSPSGARIVKLDKNGIVTADAYYYDESRTAEPKAIENAAWTAGLKGRVLFSSPIERSGNVYAATIGDSYPMNCGVFCLDSETGKIKWEYKTKNSVRNNMAYENGKLYAQDAEGSVVCLDAATGKAIWEKQLKLGNTLNTSTNVVLDGGILYAGSVRCITALDAATGEIKWEKEDDRGENSAARFVVAGDLLLVNQHWGRLLALDKSTGEKKWENDDSKLRFRSSTVAVLEDGSLLAADNNAVMHINAQTGEITSKTEFEGYDFAVSSQPLVIGDRAFIGTGNRGAVIYDIKGKKIVKEIKTGESLVFTAPYEGKGSSAVESGFVPDGESVYFGGADGVIYKVSAKDGKIEKTYEIGAAMFGAPIIGEDYIIVADFLGRVTKLAK